MGRLMARRGTAVTVSTATTVAIAGAILLVAAFPLFWAVLNSLKHLLDIVTPVPRFIFTPTLANYEQVLSSPRC